MSLLTRKAPKNVRGRNISYRPELDGIRGLSIIMIVFHHFDYVGYNFFGGRGFLGVDIFFVLSGFLITQILLKGRENKTGLTNFYIRRVARLYPILLVSVLGISYYFRNNYQFLDHSPAINSILYIKNFAPWGGVFGPLWSLSAEEQFYLIFPAILYLGLRFLKNSTFSFVLALYTLGIWITAFISSAPDHNFNLDGVFNLVIFRPSILLVGCIIALNKQKFEAAVARRVHVYLLIFIIFTWATIEYQFPPFAGIATGILILLVSEQAVQRSIFNRFARFLLAFRPLAWIGLLSYSIYIWHLPLIFINTHHFQIKAISNMPLFFLQLLLIAMVSFYGIERPVMQFITRFVKKKAKAH